MQRVHHRSSFGSMLVLSIVVATPAGCGDDTASSASATDSSGSSSTGPTGGTDPTTTSGTTTTDTTGSSQSDSDSQTGSTTATPTTGDTTTGSTTAVTGETTDSGTSSTTTTGDTTTTTTTGDTTTTTTTGDTSTTTTGDTSTGGETTGGEVLPGSCRASESYGSAGAAPAFADPAYAAFLGKAVAVTTTSTQADPYVLHIVDISGPPPPPNANYAAPRYHSASWTVANLGRIFGVTLDSQGNIYVAASTVHGATPQPGVIKRIDAVSGEITDFVDLPNNGPAFGNLNYDCVSESIYVTSHEDGRIYQINLKGQVVSSYRHSTKDVSLGLPADPGEPDSAFVPLGERVWAVQSHAGRLYYSVWWEDTNRANAGENNEVWSVAYVDAGGVPDPATAKLEFKLPDGLLSPASDITFAATGRMLVARRTMFADAQTLAHQSDVLSYDHVNGVWEPLGELHMVGELAKSAAGGVDHDFADGGYVWMTGDALDFYTAEVVYGLQGTPYAGGGIADSTLIDLDGDLLSQAKTAQGDVEVPIPDDAAPVAWPE